MTDLQAAAALAEQLADAARPIARRYFRSGIGFERKADASPVTAADREVERVMRDMIEAVFPDHGIFGEEHGRVRLDSPWVWVLDPIDGTKSFVSGKPLFGTLVALLHDNDPVVGVIEMPALNERWVGVQGRPTTFNGQSVTARGCAGLADAWLSATSPLMFKGDDAAAFDRLQAACHTAVYGADCYAYGLIANGTVDVVCEASTKPYDYCALVPVVRGAGGVITDWQGAPLGLTSDGRVLAAGDARVHDAALTALVH